MAASYIHGITHHEQVWDKVEKSETHQRNCGEKECFFELFIHLASFSGI